VHPITTESGIDELDEAVEVEVVPSEMDGSMISYAASTMTMNGKIFCYSVLTSPLML
jgi:hypothetical protein